MALTVPVSATSSAQCVRSTNEASAASISPFSDVSPFISIPRPTLDSALSLAKNQTAAPIASEDASPQVADRELSDFSLQAKAITNPRWPQSADDFSCKPVEYFRPRHVVVDCSHAPLDPEDEPPAIWRLYTVEFAPCGLSYSPIGTDRWARKFLVEVAKHIDAEAMAIRVNPTWESIEEGANNWGNGIRVKFPLRNQDGSDGWNKNFRIEDAVHQAVCWHRANANPDFVNLGCYKVRQ